MNNKKSSQQSSQFSRASALGIKTGLQAGRMMLWAGRAAAWLGLGGGGGYDGPSAVSGVRG